MFPALPTSNTEMKKATHTHICTHTHIPHSLDSSSPIDLFFLSRWIYYGISPAYSSFYPYPCQLLSLSSRHLTLGPLFVPLPSAGRDFSCLRAFMWTIPSLLFSFPYCVIVSPLIPHVLFIFALSPVSGMSPYPSHHYCRTLESETWVSVLFRHSPTEQSWAWFSHL